MYIVLLQNLLRPNVGFIAAVKVDISSNKLQTRKYFQEKSRDHIYNVIYRPNLSRDILNVSSNWHHVVKVEYSMYKQVIEYFAHSTELNIVCINK